MNGDLATVASVLLVYLAVVVGPGPNFALIMRLTVSGAPRAAIGATVGFALAATVYGILSMTGLAIVLQRIGWLAQALQMAGGLFLIHLGVRAWREAGARPSAGPSTLYGDRIMRGLRMGVLVNLSNPKAIIFFIGLYAAAITPDTALWAKLAILAGGFLVEIVWYGLAILVLSSRPARAAYHRLGRWLERATGAVLCLFGLRLLTERA